MYATVQGGIPDEHPDPRGSACEGWGTPTGTPTAVNSTAPPQRPGHWPPISRTGGARCPMQLLLRCSRLPTAALIDARSRLVANVSWKCTPRQRRLEDDDFINDPAKEVLVMAVPT